MSTSLTRSQRNTVSPLVVVRSGPAAKTTVEPSSDTSTGAATASGRSSTSMGGLSEAVGTYPSTVRSKRSTSLPTLATITAPSPDIAGGPKSVTALGGIRSNATASGSQRSITSNAASVSAAGRGAVSASTGASVVVVRIVVVVVVVSEAVVLVSGVGSTC